MDKIVALKHHPTAKDLLLSVSNDHGSPSLRLWNTSTGTLALTVPLPSFGAVSPLLRAPSSSLKLKLKLTPSSLSSQISSVAWSPDGAHLALATKSRTLHILDPRSPSPSSTFTCPSHDSPRSIHVTWSSNTHIITTGFSKSATREVMLYALSPDGVKRIATRPGDVSPSPFFPFVDQDTGILFLYSRGERSCHAFEVQPEERIPFVPLPGFENGTLQTGFAFLGKKRNDVKGVEVLRALRLTPSTVEVVSFSVPRARVS